MGRVSLEVYKMLASTKRCPYKGKSAIPPFRISSFIVRMERRSYIAFYHTTLSKASQTDLKITMGYRTGWVRPQLLSVHIRAGTGHWVGQAGLHQSPAGASTGRRLDWARLQYLLLDVEVR